MLRLVVGRLGRSGAVERVEKRVIVTRVADGVERTKNLSKSALDRTARALRRFRSRAAALGARVPRVVATGAFRHAKNREAARRFLRQESGLSIEVIAGAREARLALLGVRGAAPEARRLALIDVGGASTEIVVADGERVRAVSRPIGVISLFERGEGARAFTAQAARAFRGVRLRAGRGVPCLAAGGAALAFAAWRASARYLKFGGGGTTLSVAALERLRRQFASAPPSVAARRLGITAAHARLIEPGHAILVAAMRVLGVDRVQPTDRGVAEGLVHEMLARTTKTARKAAK